MADFLYKTTDYYAPTHERSILWSDETLGIEWPDISQPPQLSGKDAMGQQLGKAEIFD
jgi:dTDP-4-dehydrorhamnose 3,5-epimerase